MATSVLVGIISAASIGARNERCNDHELEPAMASALGWGEYDAR